MCPMCSTPITNAANTTSTTMLHYRASVSARADNDNDIDDDYPEGNRPRDSFHMANTATASCNIYIRIYMCDMIHMVYLICASLYTPEHNVHASRSRGVYIPHKRASARKRKRKRTTRKARASDRRNFLLRIANRVRVWLANAAAAAFRPSERL